MAPFPLLIVIQIIQFQLRRSFRQEENKGEPLVFSKVKAKGWEKVMKESETECK